ncbi:MULTISPECIES: mechanosensitive ion channel family protein [Streptomyces]|jgi:small-conductance mechanosensitive channel|uniref:Mechanosensitive ion channel protein n=2 Tax=Streptomyces TaxID=1883 RepID=A0A514JW84_9ACTN|nr:MULTISPECIES: mechanosensitive ion channel domain-containing protein [Streptomyces]MBA8943253.1 small-conductance mechanosensitive channel [Streptomyces calvus]MBA8978948.1 small-conductance mechanosensitive channel [Streptomyces calvus]MYS26021.1 mechanosensitive ion channel [Streptomyces sp. SID7804]QDI71599.1 mechanosensitive ion channel protein [Streptomyces calvus]GGP36185.1 mechanosensitive ion channel protein [Streptomyces calvus]
MDDVLRPLIVVGGSVVLTLLLGWVTDLLLRKADERHHETPLWGLLRRARIPYQLLLCAALLRGSYDEARLLQSHEVGVGRTLTLVLIGSAAWLVIRIAAAVVETSYSSYASSRHRRDPARVRRVRTQVTLIRRVVSAVVGVVAVAAMLLTFPAMRAAGASLLASAGILGIVAGVAAQSTLSNMFAGLQIAFGDMVRIGDTVVVDGEWGTVEEITLTFLTVRTWDERRITMPVSYFTSKPFENWSRGTPQMTGIVFWHLDHSAPLEAMRDKLRDILRECPAWDGRAHNLSVTDSTPSTIEVRALVTAKDADDIWTVRVEVRERMIRWLTEEHPYALPRVNTADAVLRPGPDGHRPADGVPAARRVHGHPRER